MGWVQSVLCISASNSSLFTKINTLLVVYRFCSLSTDNFSHLWCITFYFCCIFSTIVLACTDCPWKPMSVHLKKMNKRNSQSLCSSVLAISTLPGLKGSSGSIAHLVVSLCWKGKLEGCWMGGVGVGVPFLFGPGNPLLISVHLKDWLTANGKKKINRWIPSLPEVTSAGRYRTSVSLGQLWGERRPLDSGLFSDSVHNIRCLPGAGSLSSLALGSGDGKKVTIASLSDLQN